MAGMPSSRLLVTDAVEKIGDLNALRGKGVSQNYAEARFRGGQGLKSRGMIDNDPLPRPHQCSGARRTGRAQRL